MGVGVRGTTEGMSGLHMQAWRQGLGMGSWRVRFGWCESRTECLRGRLQVSMTRAGSIWPGASMHAMYMHMHMRTLLSLIAFLCCSGGPARAVRVAGRRRPGVGLCTSSAHTHSRSLAQKQDTCTCKGQCKRAHAPRLSGCVCSISGSAARPWVTVHATARLAQQNALLRHCPARMGLGARVKVLRHE